MLNRPHVYTAADDEINFVFPFIAGSTHSGLSLSTH